MEQPQMWARRDTLDYGFALKGSRPSGRARYHRDHAHAPSRSVRGSGPCSATLGTPQAACSRWSTLFAVASARLRARARAAGRSGADDPRRPGQRGGARQHAPPPGRRQADRRAVRRRSSSTRCGAEWGDSLVTGKPVVEGADDGPALHDRPDGDADRRSARASASRSASGRRAAPQHLADYVARMGSLLGLSFPASSPASSCSARLRHPARWFPVISAGRATIRPSACTAWCCPRSISPSSWRPTSRG